ncbi:hypothetical protein FRC03_005737 [Tulasnella sp. 419]|nr:hypothetical protein FRC03_005737 [Tulasnella sp. 419]
MISRYIRTIERCKKAQSLETCEMARFSTPAISALALALLGAVNACWEQCGGTGYTGPTTCAAPCVCVYSNPWYSQCVPAGTTSSTLTSSKLSSSTSKTSSTSNTSKTSSTTTSSSTPSGTAKPTKYWFSFGDSYTSTTFDIAGTLPNDANPIGNPVYPGYTACGMVTNWIDVDTVKYNTSKVYTYNFAYGGATIDANLVTPYQPTVKSLTDQVNSFLATVGPKPASTPWTSSNSIFSFFIGINDMGGSWWLNTDGAFSDTLLDAYFALVQKVYDVGGRNFLFINVPGVNRSPLMLAQTVDAQEGERVVIEAFNAKLAARVASFKASHSGTQTWVYDSYSRLVQILNNPSAYGLKDATSYGSGTDVAWCNDYHISPPVHEVYGQDIATLITPGFF